MDRFSRGTEGHERWARVRSLPVQARLQRESEAADRRIDQLVCELYGLTEEEINIVEESQVLRP